MRIKVNDAVAVGKKIVEWTLEANTRPKGNDIRDFVAKMDGALTVTDPKVTKFQLIETPADTIVIRLPQEDMLRRARDKYDDRNNPGLKADLSQFPEWERDLVDTTKLTGLKAAEVFYMFVGDYTTTECE